MCILSQFSQNYKKTNFKSCQKAEKNNIEKAQVKIPDSKSEFQVVDIVLLHLLKTGNCFAGKHL